MASNDKTLKARLPRGFADRSAADIRATEAMVARIRRVYERYGFEPVETPLIEFTESLGKFLPDQDRPNEGVFSFRDDDEEWLSLRYDLTAPLARYVAENYDKLPKPYRSYRFGWVFRNEKPGPGRFRQFMQFDADTVGAASPAADAEMCMMMADVMEELLGGKEAALGKYVIKVSSRAVLDGLLEAQGIDDAKKLAVLRTIDKFDRLKEIGVYQLLGGGRRDESGDFTPGQDLPNATIKSIINFITGEGETWADTAKYSPPTDDEWLQTSADLEAYTKVPAEPRRTFFYSNARLLDQWAERISNSSNGTAGVDSLRQMNSLLEAAGYGSRRVRLSGGTIRGLEYYTGAVFEAELLAEIPNEKGQPVVFGSVGGGGRYDGLVGRFMKDNVPATGFSIGVSRLQAALLALGKIGSGEEPGPVLVTVMDPPFIARYQAMVSQLRAAGIAAELYLGKGRFGTQMKYADRRRSPFVVIQGENERSQSPPVVQIKDMRVGLALSTVATNREAWTNSRRLSQQIWPEIQLVEAISGALGRGEGRAP